MQLDVRGCASVQASFEKFCEVERMEGRDQYQTEVHGLQARACAPSLHFRARVTHRGTPPFTQLLW